MNIVFHTKKTFTLIELLIVIAIIAILASMLMPSLKRANDAAKQIVCINNMKNIGMFFHLYIANNNDKFPLTYKRDATQSSGVGSRKDWTDFLNEYDGRNMTEDAQWNSLGWEDFYDESTYGSKSLLQVYQCPLSKSASQANKAGGDIPKQIYAHNSYVMHSAYGATEPLHQHRRGPSTAIIIGADGNYQSDARDSGGKFFYQGWQAKIGEISNTRGILLTEYPTKDNHIGSSLSLNLIDYAQDIGPNSQNEIGDTTKRFGSMEEAWPHGLFQMNFLSVDGSVAFLSMSDTTDLAGHSWYDGNTDPDEKDNGMWDLFPGR